MSGAGPAYDERDGFVVHEWGTNTIVVGSDGSLQAGLEHEEEGLPAFVYDRIKNLVQTGEQSMLALDCTNKLETPITYFYSPEPLTARVSVDFPRGVFTQWYPAVDLFYPLIAQPCGDHFGPAEDNPNPAADPHLDASFPFRSEVCREQFAEAGGGLLDWGEVEVLERNALAPVPEAPLLESTWGYAREVDANSVRIPGRIGDAESERFLFYRGLGNFDLPLSVSALGERELALGNQDSSVAMGTVFLLNVSEDRGAFRVLTDGVAAGQSVSATAPALGDAPPTEEFLSKLGESMTAALVATGLYRDEAVAMVNTWKRQWFGTPGLRVLYLLPQAWTDRMIPLRVDPSPDRTIRTVVIRVEVITPEIEDADVAAARMLEGEKAAHGEGHFDSLGRFAEPRLRRALALLGEPAYGAPLLQRIGGVGLTVSAGE